MITQQIRACVAALWSVVVLLVVPQIAEADLKKVEERTVGRWKLTAVVQTDTDFALCLVTTLNDLGEHLNISVERPKHLWSLAFAGRDVRLRQGAASDFEVTYAIDDNEPSRVQAIPSASGRVFVPLGKDVALTEPVRHGSRIAFETADGTHAFSLAGSSAALDALSDCANRHLGFADTKTPATSPIPPSTSAVQSADPPLDIPMRLGGGRPQTVDTYVPTRVGFWTVDAADGPTGAFDHCWASRAFIGTDVTFVLDRNHVWVMKLSAKLWKPPLNRLLEVRFTLDGVSQAGLIATAATPDELPIELGKEPIFLEQWRQAKTLRVEVADYEFNLDATTFGGAFDPLRECAAYYIGADDIRGGTGKSAYHTQSHGEPALPPGPLQSVP